MTGEIEGLGISMRQRPRSLAVSYKATARAARRAGGRSILVLAKRTDCGAKAKTFSNLLRRGQPKRTDLFKIEDSDRLGDEMLPSN